MAARLQDHPHTPTSLPVGRKKIQNIQQLYSIKVIFPKKIFSAN